MEINAAKIEVKIFLLNGLIREMGSLQISEYLKKINPDF